MPWARALGGARPGRGGAPLFFFFNDTATTESYTTVHTLSLHDALPILRLPAARRAPGPRWRPASPTARSEEHTSELQSRTVISYAVFCSQKKTKRTRRCWLRMWRRSTERWGRKGLR